MTDKELTDRFSQAFDDVGLADILAGNLPRPPDVDVFLDDLAQTLADVVKDKPGYNVWDTLREPR